MKNLIILLFVIFQLQGLAHPGGHGSLVQPETQWSLSSGQTIDGHFLYGQGNNTMILETSDGALIRVNVSMLTPADQVKALGKIRQVAAINQSVASDRSWFEGISIWMVLASVLGALLFHSFVSHKFHRYIYFRGGLSELTLLSFSTCTFLLLTIACKRRERLIPFPRHLRSSPVPERVFWIRHLRLTEMK